MYTLPSDAPSKLKNLLKRWQDVAKDHPPTQRDLPFDGLVGEHPGLMLVEPVTSDKGITDLNHVRAGPAHVLHTGAKLQGKFYSQTLSPKVFERMVAVYRAVLETGEPHYWQRINGVYGAPPVEFSRLLLPLYDDRGEAECLIGSWVWKDDLPATVSQSDLAQSAN